MLFGFMANDGTLTALLASYGALPGIFMTDAVPADAARPYIWAPGPVARAPLVRDMDRTALPVVVQDIGCYVDSEAPGQGSAACDAIAERVWQIFNENGAAVVDLNFSHAGWRLLEATVIAGPLIAPTDPSIIGRIVTVEAKYRPA